MQNEWCTKFTKGIKFIYIQTPGTLTFETNGPSLLILQLNPDIRMKVRSSYLLNTL